MIIFQMHFIINLFDLWVSIHLVNPCDLIQGKDETDKAIDVGAETSVVGA